MLRHWIQFIWNTCTNVDQAWTAQRSSSRVHTKMWNTAKIFQHVEAMKKNPPL